MKIKLTVFTLLISIHIVSPFIDQIFPNYNFQRLAEAIQKEKNKVQIIGYGKTRGQAFMDAQRNAKKKLAIITEKLVDHILVTKVIGYVF